MEIWSCKLVINYGILKLLSIKQFRNCMLYSFSWNEEVCIYCPETNKCWQFVHAQVYKLRCLCPKISYFAVLFILLLYYYCIYLCVDSDTF